MDDNNFNRSQAEYQLKLAKKLQRKKIRSAANLVGGGLLLFLLFNNIIGLAQILLGKLLGCGDDPFFQTSVQIIGSISYVLVPFSIIGRAMKKNSGIREPLPLAAPQDKTLSALAVPFGLGVCMAANIVTSFIVVSMKLFGVELTSPDIPQPGGAFGFVLSVTATAVTAGIAEELALRGIVMQNLRVFGDSFAIVMSALAFGIMHMNLIQAPFAIMVGLALGYITVKTGSLWPAIVIHILNNFISVLVSYLPDWGVSEQSANTVYSALLYLLIGFGAAAAYLFVLRAKRTVPSVQRFELLKPLSKAFAFFTSPTIIIAVIMLLIITAEFVKTSS